ncbi:unnamed protein product [Prunus armeniaca]
MWDFVQVVVVVTRVMEIRFNSLRELAVGSFGRCLAPWKSVFLRHGRRRFGAICFEAGYARLIMVCSSTPSLQSRSNFWVGNLLDFCVIVTEHSRFNGSRKAFPSPPSWQVRRSPGLGSMELSIGRGRGLEALAREPWGAKFEKQGARPMEYI